MAGILVKRVKCNSCGATYATTDTNGVTYFHMCPPEIVGTPEVTDSVTHAILTPAVFIPTPNPRNENLKPHPEKPGEHVMISEGSGVTPVE